MSTPAANPESENSTTNITGITTYSSSDGRESLIKTINSREEFNELLKSIKDKYIIVEFYAAWCRPCLLLNMKFQEIAQKYQNKLEIFKIDIDDLEELAFEYEMVVMPSYMIMKNGEKLEQYFGSKLEQLDGMVQKYLEKNQT